MSIADDEVQEVIDAARSGDYNDLAIPHCVSGYPAPAEDYNLRSTLDMREPFRLVTGFSNHTIVDTTTFTSVALGSSIIKNHSTLGRNDGGPDDSSSLESEI